MPQQAAGSGQSGVGPAMAPARRHTDADAQRPVLLIVEMSGEGHRLFYVSVLAEAAAQRGYHVVIAFSADVSDELIDTHLHGAARATSVLRAEAFTVHGINATADRVGATTVIVPDGDRLAMKLGSGRRWRTPATLRVLVTRWEMQAEGRRIALRARLKILAKRSLIHLASRRSRVEVYVLRSPLWRGSLPLPAVLDPLRVTATEADMRQLIVDWKLTRDRTWLGVLGAVNARKNVELIVAAMRAVPHRRLGLLVAGTVDAGTMTFLEKHSRDLTEAGHELVVVNRLLSDSELDCALAAVDVLMLAYSNEGPSGLLIKAQALGTTIIGAGAASLREDLAAMRRTGDRWCELSVASLAGALAELTPQQSRSFETHGSAESFVRPLIEGSSA